MEDRVRLTEALAALLDPETTDAVLVARSLAEPDDARPSWRVPGGRVVDDAALGRALREVGERARVVATATVDPTLLRALRDQPPALLVLTGPAEAELLDDLRRLARGRRPCALLGPRATLRVDPSRAGPGAVLACAANQAELDRLESALAGAWMALSPTPGWLPTWLSCAELEPVDAVGYVPAPALTMAWVDWIRGLGERELRQLLVPLGVPRVDLERPRDPGLEPALVAHTLERRAGPTYPAPRVLGLLHEGVARHLGTARVDRLARTDAPDDPGALALWDQARRALPRLGEIIGMQEPDPDLPLRVPTAAFLAQRGMLRVRASQRLLAGDRSRLGRIIGMQELDPEMIERADAVLEGAAEALSDQDSKVVLRGHGIEVTRQAFATSASGAANFADKIGYPVALKALSPDLRRKRELGAVELDVANAAATKRAYAQIVANVEERAPTARLDGVVVAEMIGPGVDLRCGGLRTESGAIALYAQPVLDAPNEPVLARSPLDEADALLMAEAVLAAAPMPARRRATDPDVTVLAALLLRLDALFRHTGERLLAVDLAPVRLLDSEREYVTLDARILQRPHLEGL